MLSQPARVQPVKLASSRYIRVAPSPPKFRSYHRIHPSPTFLHTNNFRSGYFRISDSNTTCNALRYQLRNIRMSSTTNKKILVLGQKMGPTDLSPEQLRAVFGEQIDSAKKAGMDMTIVSVDVERPVDANIKDVLAVLKQEQWDGICVGGGIRATDNNTPLFEEIMNTIVQTMQPVPRLAFPTRPHLVWDAVCRVWGVQP